MPSPSLHPHGAALAPDAAELTPYDLEHLVTYLRLLDADAANADWREVARIILHIDAETERARRTYESHLSRAKWMVDHGYKDLLREGA